MKPIQVFKSSAKEYWFDCYCGHTFKSSLDHIFNNSWCSYCANKKLCDKEDCKQCYEKSFASSNKAKYWSKENKIIPRQVFKVSAKEYLFDCLCGHIISKKLSVINADTWCSYCCNPVQKLCGKKNCKLCVNNSLLSTLLTREKINCWNNKNKLEPHEVIKGSNKLYLFDCDICKHQIGLSPYDINNYIWCYYCSGKRLCDKKDCKQCYEKSFASHEKAKFWSKTNKIAPRQIFKVSAKEYLFDCSCGHIFNSPVSNITNGNEWCPFCSNSPKKLCDKKDCNQCYEKSFASSDKAKYWSKENKIMPRQVFKNSHSIFVFICEKNHNFNKNVSLVTRGRWCPFCINKTEQKLFDQLIKLYPTLQQQFKVKWCKNKTYLPFDFVIPEYNIIIELDGPQHFMQISNWASPEETNINDKYKMECANKNNYSVIRLTQEDVFYDKYNWKEELLNNIEKIKNDKIIQNIYMCKNNEYDVFNDHSKELVV